jgi:hypothetical protein
VLAWSIVGEDPWSITSTHPVGNIDEIEKMLTYFLYIDILANTGQHC